MNPIDLLQQSGSFFISRLEQVPADAWNKPTPCPDWDVRTVAVHIINGLKSVPALLAGEVMDPAQRNADKFGDNLLSEAKSALTAAVKSFSQPGALDKMVSAPAGQMPAKVYAFLRASDTVIHTWDMAKGAGIDTTIPDDLAEAIIAVSPREFMEGARQKGAFGPLIEVGPDADAQTQLLALYGRKA